MILKLVDIANNSGAALGGTRYELVADGVVPVLVEFRHRNIPASAVTRINCVPAAGNGAVDAPPVLVTDDSE
jgi:hypothetical protein